MADPCNCGGGHAHWGQCQKSKNLRIAYCNSASGKDKTSQDRLDRDLAMYREASEGGLAPNSTQRKDVIATMEAAS